MKKKELAQSIKILEGLLSTVLGMDEEKGKIIQNTIIFLQEVLDNKWTKRRRRKK